MGRLHYCAKLLYKLRVTWSRLPELNRRPSNYESDALPTELSRPKRRNSSAETRLHYTKASFVVSSHAQIEPAGGADAEGSKEECRSLQG
jgi:hypothetical protein